MTERLTLPQQRAQETRRRILDTAYGVFARLGYGQTSVEDIIAQAGISRGAFYHHFSGKEELFKTLLDDHIEQDVMEFGPLSDAASPREVIERFVTLQINDMKLHEQSGSLSFEFMAEAAREAWARTAFAGFHRQTHHLIASLLRFGQGTGAVRTDVDVESAAWLLLSIYEGLSTLHTIDPEINVMQLKKPWADLIERFVGLTSHSDKARDSDPPGRGHGASHKEE